MWASSAIFLIGLAATTFAAAGLFFFACEGVATRKLLAHRVEFFALARRPPARAGDGRATGAFTITALSGDELEFARRLEPLHIPAALAPRLLLLLRVAAGLILPAALVWLFYRHADLAELPNMVGLGLAGAVIGWSLPHQVVDRLALHRRRAVGHGLADALELLVISVEAGLSLEDAINRIVGELRRSRPAMAEELASKLGAGR